MSVTTVGGPKDHRTTKETSTTSRSSSLQQRDLKEK